MIRIRLPKKNIEGEPVESNAGEKHKKIGLLIRILLLILFLSALVFLTVRYGPAVTRLFAQPQRIRDYLLSFGLAAPLMLIFFQIVQIVIAFIPGEVVQVAGGYVFGTALGTLYAVIGSALGTLLAFFAARLLGFELVKVVVPQRTLDRFDFLVNSNQSELVIFILFLVPGLPKDTLTYLAGLTPIKPFRFLFISLLARFPGLLGTAYVGAHLAKKSYWPVAIVAALSLLLFVLGLFYGDKVLRAVRRRWSSQKGK